MAAKPIEVAAILKDLFSGSAERVAAAAAKVAAGLERIVPAAKTADAALAKFFGTTDAIAKGVSNAAQATNAFGTATAAKFPGITRAISGLATAATATGKAVSSAFGSIVKSAGSVISSLLSVRSALTAIAIGFVSSRIVVSFLATADAMSELAGVSRRTGIAIDQLSRLRAAAKLSNVEFESLAKSLQTFQRNLGGGQNSVIFALRDLGISDDRVKSVRDVSELLPDIAAGLDRLDQNQRASVLSKLFGASAAGIQTFLEGGVEKFEASLKKVDEFGLALGKSQVSIAADVADAVVRLGLAWEKVKVSIVAAIGPTTQSLLDALAKQLSALPQRVSNLSNLISVATQDSADGKQAREMIAELARSFGDALLDGAVAIGTLIGKAFIGVVLIGISALTPAFQRLFRDALGPVLNFIPGVNIEKTKQAQAAEIETRLKIENISDRELNARRNLAIYESEQAQKNLDAAMRRIDIVTGKATGLPGENAAFQAEDRFGKNHSIDRLKAARAAKAAADNVVRSFDKLVALRGEIADESDAVIKGFSEKVGEFLSGIRESGGEISGVFKKFLDQFVRVLDSAGRFQVAPSETAQTQPTPAPSRSVLTEEQRRAVEVAQMEIASQRERIQGREREAAIIDIETAKVKALADAQQTYGIATSAVLRNLAKLFELQRDRVNADAEAESITRRLAELQRLYSDAVRDTSNAVVRGQVTQSEANKLNQDTARQTAQMIAELIVRADELRAKFPDVKAFQDLRTTLAETKAELETPPDTRGWGQALFDLNEQIKGFIQSASNTLADGFVNAFESIIEGTQSVGVAFQNLAADVLKAVASMILKLLVLQAIVLTLKALGVPTELLGLASGANRGGLIGRDERVVRRAGGGFIPGRGPNRDTVPALLTKGEFVHRRAAVDYYGVRAMEAINARLIPRAALAGFGAAASVAAATTGFNSGGEVGPAPSPVAAVAPAVLVASEQSMERLIAGGPNALLQFLRDNRGKF